MGMLVGGGFYFGDPVSISPVSTNITYSVGSGTGYAILEYNSNGIEYKNASGGSTSMTSSRGNWLDTGNSSAVFVKRILNSGTFNYSDIGSSRVALSTSQKCGISRSSTGTTVTDADFEFYDAAVGGNLITSVNIVFTVNNGL